MLQHDDSLLEQSMRVLRERHIDPVWDQLDHPNRAVFEALWQELAQFGLTTLGLASVHSSPSLPPSAQLVAMRELGAAAPALGFALISHLTAIALLTEACGNALPLPLHEAIATARFAWVGSPLDSQPETPFTLEPLLCGTRRVGLAHPDWIVVLARQEQALQLCVVAAQNKSVRFAARPSSHGLRLVPFGELHFEDICPAHTCSWPNSGQTARWADGLVAALLCGMMDELAKRSMRYAKERYQGGKMIHEHDAVRALVGPIELARRPLGALALATLAEKKPGDGGASAFAVDLVREAGLDAIQTLGGAGYMHDFGVERYLRDAGTLETCWIHAATRRRDIARARINEMQR